MAARRGSPDLRAKLIQVKIHSTEASLYSLTQGPSLCANRDCGGLAEEAPVEVRRYLPLADTYLFEANHLAVCLG